MRLIDADEYARDMKERQDAALRWCDDAKNRCDYADYALAKTACSIFCEAKLTLDKQPTVDAVPVVHATLEDIGIVEDDREWVCSNCKAEFTVCVCGKDRTRYIQYCPYCGAMIIGERKEGTSDGSM